MSYDPEKAGARCSECPLYGCTVVPPDAPTHPKIAIVGEGPGYLEEKKKRPFVGPSGILLNQLLEQSGLDRKDALVTNAVLCRAWVPDENVRESKRHDIPTYLAWLRKENARRRKEATATGQDIKILADPFVCCAPRLWNELRWAENSAVQSGQPNGLVVIPLGNKALEATTGKVGILKWRGSPMKPIGANT